MGWIMQKEVWVGHCLTLCTLNNAQIEAHARHHLAPFRITSASKLSPFRVSTWWSGQGTDGGNKGERSGSLGIPSENGLEARQRTVAERRCRQ